MEVMDAIYGRRSIRKYTDQEIPYEDLKEILEAGLMAPSAMNLQQWYFVMVRDKSRIEESREIMSKVFDTFKPVLTERFSKHPHIVHETSDFMKTLGGAPAILLAFVSREDYNKSLPAVSGVCAALQNMLLAAYAKGIGSCWLTAPITAHMEDEFERRFAPGKGRFVAFVTLGYPDETPPIPPRRSGKYEIL
jgi:nitroreductase